MNPPLSKACLLATLYVLFRVLVRVRRSSNIELNTRHRELAYNPSTVKSQPSCQSWFGACVCTASELAEAVARVSTTDSVHGSSTIIALCRSSRIQLSQPINVSFKSIALRCGGRSFWNALIQRACIIDGNKTTRLLNGQDAVLSLHGIVLVNGQLSPNEDGGALAMTNSIVTLDSCHLSNHSAPNGAGGAMYLDGGSLNASRTVWINNTAVDGGALAVRNNARVTIAYNRFLKNQARAGGAGIFNSGTVWVESTMFLSNTATSVVSTFEPQS
jgi:hypothetical protein